MSGNEFAEDPWSSHTAHLWRETATEFDEVHVFARGQRQAFTTSARGKVMLHLIPRISRRMVVFVLTSWLLPVVAIRVRPTVIQAQSAVHGGLAAVATGRLIGAPVLVEVHGEHYVRPGMVGQRSHRWFIRPLAALCFRHASAIRSLSQEMTDGLIKTYGSSIEAKIVEVGNRVDLTLFTPAKVDYTRHRRWRFAMVGALNANKNQVGLVSDLATAGVDCELLLAGGGPHVQDILDASKGTSVEVRLLGVMEHRELASMLRDCDAYIHYSRSEAVSRSVLEAMALGLPVIVGPSGFLGGIVTDGVTGVRLNELSPTELRKGLDALALERDRSRLGHAARDQIVAHHEWKAVFARYLGVLSTLQLDAENGS